MAYEITVQVLKKLVEENERVKAAGSKRNDPSTWRPDLTRPVNEYVEEIHAESQS